MPHRLLDLANVADYLHLSREDVETLIRRHEIPCERCGARLGFRRKDVDAWASQRILGLEQKPLREYHNRSSAKTQNILHHNAISADILKSSCVTANLAGRTKPAVLRAMVKLAERSEIGFDPEDLLKALRDREELCSTALPGGIALLHPRHHEPYMFEDSFLAFGKTTCPVPFGSSDGNLTDLFFLICCQDDRLHLHVLSRLCLMATRTTLLHDLRAASDADAICLAIKNAESEIIRTTVQNPQNASTP